MHWNAEGVLNKQTDLQHVLHENNITICCMQETHLQPKKLFKVRGYQCFRSDRIGRSQGRILTLVRNNIDAIQTTTHTDDSEFQVLNLKKKDFHMKLVNLYPPNDKALSLNALPAQSPSNTNVKHEGSKGKGRHTKLQMTAWTRTHIERTTSCTQTAKGKEIFRPRCNHK